MASLRLLSRWQSRILLSFLLLYIFAVGYCHQAYYRDPGSFFFNPQWGYQPNYSLIRRQQAESYIASFSSFTPPETDSNVSKDGRVMCIGIPTVKRPSEQYIDISVGSLLDSLTQAERDGIHMDVLFAHTDPSEHPSYSAPWVPYLLDTVLTYDTSDPGFEHLKSLEANRMFAEKGVFDYVYMLDSCYKTNAQYIAIFEDDVLAQEGWYARAVSGLRDLEKQGARDENGPSWLYMRLFYTEKFLGWNSEEWPTYAFWSMCVILTPALAALFVRRKIPSLRNSLSNTFLTIITLICVPACIILYFLAGRVSMQPLQPGVNQMSNFGCCSQGLVFPREMVPRLMDQLTKMNAGPIDSLIEIWADEEDLQRWALTPSVVQHIGRKSAKAKPAAAKAKAKSELNDARGLWNFAFELNDVNIVKDEHLDIVDY